VQQALAGSKKKTKCALAPQRFQVHRSRWMRNADDHRRNSSLTVSLCRPFLRRRLSTLRPPRVAIRARNPCLFRRFRLCGWYVRFIPSYPLFRKKQRNCKSRMLGQIVVPSFGYAATCWLCEQRIYPRSLSSNSLSNCTSRSENLRHTRSIA